MEIIFYGDDFFMKKFCLMFVLSVSFALCVLLSRGGLNDLLKNHIKESSSVEKVAVSTNLGFVVEQSQGSQIKYVSGGKEVGECIEISKKDLQKVCEKLGLMITSRYWTSGREIIEGVSALTKYSIAGKAENIQICIDNEKVLVGTPIIYGSF